MMWSTACLDWKQRIVEQRSLVPIAPLFPEEAEAGLEVFKALRVADVAGSPSMGDISRGWVFDFVRAIFGAYDPAIGRRLINEFFLLISKKNSKSTIAAGIMITALLLNWRKSAEFTILAPSLEIANNSAEPAMDMIAEDPELRRILKPIPHLKTIEHINTGASLRVLSADSKIVGGSKSAGVLIDELWLFGKMKNAAEMLREATGGLASRPEGFVIALSTQSDEPPAGVFKDWLNRFRDIRDGRTVAPRSLGVLYEFPEEMIKNEAFKDPRNFYITNPNLGASVDEQYLLDELSKATDPKLLAGFLAKHLNIEIGTRLRSDRWAGADVWDGAVDSALTLDELLRRCEVVVVGIDGGGLDDLFGVAVVGRERIETEIEVEVDNDAGQKVKVKRRIKRWLVWGKAWCHEIVLDRRKSIATQLRGFQKDGELVIVEMPGDDVAQIVAVCKRVKDAGLLAKVAVDPAGIGEFVDALADEEVDITQENDLLVGVSQGYALMNAIKTGERKLANGTLLHAPSELMNWAVGNLKIEPTATAIRPTKQHAGDAKIDPVMAMFNAISVMATNPEAPGISIYDRMAVQDAGKPAADNGIDWDILRNPKHPRWNEMRERYDRTLPVDDEDFP